MLDTIDITLLPVFLLLFARVIAFFITLPLFSYRTIPTWFKIGFSVFLAFIMLPIIDTSTVNLDVFYPFLLVKEVLIGLMIGLIAYIIISAIQIAGGFIDFQMGFAIANVIDPQTGAQSPLIGQFLYIVSLLFFLAVDGHHLLIDGIFNSYRFIPLDTSLQFEEDYMIFILQKFSGMFLIAFQMAIPIVGCLFLVDVALGLLARTVPQLNVFVVGLPLKIFVSFSVILFFLSIFVVLIRILFNQMFETMRDLMFLLGGG